MGFNRINYLLSFSAGALAVLSFAPFEYWFLLYPSLIWLFLQWYRQGAKQAFIHGFCFGLGFFLVGVSWVYVSITTYGGMPVWMAVVAVFLFCSLLACFIALTGWSCARLTAASTKSRIALISPLWIIFEWAKSWVLTGFPWLEIGYSQTDTWLAGLAPIGGNYLVGFLAVLIAAIVSFAIAQRQALVLTLLVPLIGLCYVLDNYKWSAEGGAKIHVGVLQPNVAVDQKWLLKTQSTTIQQLMRMSEQLNAEQAIDLMVWPETAIPLFVDQIDDTLWRSLFKGESQYISGLLDRDEDGAIYNAAVLACGEQRKVYRKQHLVPFGEYLPLRFLFAWVLDYLKIPMSDFSAADSTENLNCGTIRASVSICYEDAFAAEWRSRVSDAGILVNLSEEGWFGNSLAPHQRIQMARMRAREFAKPLVKSANTGPSVIIDQRGEIIAESEQFVATNLFAEIRPSDRPTPFQRYGNWIVYAAIAFSLLIALIARKSLPGQAPQNNQQRPSP